MMNPKMIFQLKTLFERLRNNHPKVMKFFSAVGQSIDEGSVIEITMTTSEGKTICTNLRVTADDLEAVETLRGQIS